MNDRIPTRCAIKRVWIGFDLINSIVLPRCLLFRLLSIYAYIHIMIDINRPNIMIIMDGENMTKI